ncbi:hypothetical protein UPYG_G00262460 [Umbra pygmaea]|uniref:Uncharacterized protein n=1 Tax=Umbra pygmaea TaxID=75934 RepID=A0ABD0W992_UMBPY
MQTSTSAQNVLDQSITAQPSSPQNNSCQMSGNPSNYSLQHRPIRPDMSHTLGEKCGTAGSHTQGSQYLHHTSGVFWSGQNLNQQASTFHLSQHPTKTMMLVNSNPLLTILLNNNKEAAQPVDVNSHHGHHDTSDRIDNSAAQYNFQQEDVSLGINNNSSKRLQTEGHSAKPYYPTHNNLQLHANVNYLQSPASGSHQLVQDRHGPSAALAMGSSPKQFNHQWTKQDSSRVPFNIPHQEHSETPTSFQSAQETHVRTSRPSLSSMTNNQVLCNQNHNWDNSRTELNRVQHEECVTARPSNHSHIYPTQYLTGRSDQINVTNSAKRQPMHCQNSPYNVMPNPPANNSSRNYPNHPASLLIPPQHDSLVSYCTNMTSHGGASGNNAHHSIYSWTNIPGTGSTIHYKQDGSYGLVSNTGSSSSVPNDGIQSSVQHPHKLPPPYPSQHSHGPMLKKPGTAVGAGAHSLHHVQNISSTTPLKHKANNAYVQISNNKLTSSVPNYGMQFSAQQNCESIPAPKTIGQGYYVTVAEDKRNGFRAENMHIFVEDKLNESAPIQQVSSASNATSFVMGQKAIAVVQPLLQSMERNNGVNKTITNTQGMSLSTGSDVSKHGDESCCHPSQVRATFTQSASLIDESKQEVSKSRPEATLESKAKKTQTLDSETTDVEMATTNSCSESIHTRTEDLADTEMNTRLHANPLSEETKVLSADDIFKLSSVPVINWTLGKLKDLITTMKPKKSFESLLESKILNLYWEGDGEKLMDAVRSDSFQNIFQEARSVCGDDNDVLPQSVIFAQVRCKYWCKIQDKCDVLNHDSVYPKVPAYRSLWLNTNEQLDDIDKEFGFPWSLINGQHALQIEEQAKCIRTENENSGDTSSNMQVEEVTQTNIPTSSESVAKENQGSDLPQCSEQTHSSVKKVSEAIIFKDPFSSLVINVLPPEEAMRIFNNRLLQDKVRDDQQRMDLPEEMDVDVIEINNTSVEDKSSEEVDLVLTDVTLENKDVQMEDYCCLARWKAVYNGYRISSCECQSKTELVSAKATVNGKMLLDKEFSVELSATDGTAEGIGEENNCKNDQPKSTIVGEFPTIVLSDSESEIDCPYTEVSSLDLPEAPTLFPSCLNIVESEEGFPNIAQFHKLDTPMSELVLDKVQPKKKTHISQKGVILKERKSRGGEAIPTVTFPTCNLQPQITKKTSFLASLSLAPRLHKQLSPKRNYSSKVKQKRIGCKRRFLESHHTKCSVPGKKRKIRDCQNLNRQILPEIKLTNTKTKFEDPNTSTPEHLKEEQPLNCSKLQKAAEPEVRVKVQKMSTVRLALFGSSPQRKNGTVATGQNKNHSSSQQRHFSDRSPTPPETLNVNVNFWKKESSKTRPLFKGTVKQRIFNEWKSSFVPTKSRGKLQNKKGFGPKIVGADVAKQTFNSERQSIPEKTLKHKQNLQCIERENILHGLKLRLKRSRSGAVPSKETAAVKKSKYELGNPALLPLEENNVLRFIVLPDSRQEPMENETPLRSLKEIATPVAEEAKNPETIVQKCEGVWSTCPQKRNGPIITSTGTNEGTKTSSTIFQEFKKKFKQRKDTQHLSQ